MKRKPIELKGIFTTYILPRVTIENMRRSKKRVKGNDPFTKWAIDLYIIFSKEVIKIFKNITKKFISQSHQENAN